MTHAPLTQLELRVSGDHLMLALLGERDGYLRVVEEAFPEARIVARGNELRITAPEADAKVVKTVFEELLVLVNGGQALDPRGELYTDANVGARLAVRNLLDELRGGGQITGGPANFSAKDRQASANQLDRWLTSAKD